MPSSRKPIVSRFFFGEVARHGSQSAYVAAVRSRSETELLDDLAGQVYEISKSAATKHKAAQQAFVCVVVFLFLWATARIALSVAS